MLTTCIGIILFLILKFLVNTERRLAILLGSSLVLAGCGDVTSSKTEALGKAIKIQFDVEQLRPDDHHEVKLKVRVLEGRVESVKFSSSDKVFTVDETDEASDFVKNVYVKEITTFTATAQGPRGTVTAAPVSWSIEANSSSPQPTPDPEPDNPQPSTSPKAPSSSQALITYKDIPFASGLAADEQLSASSSWALSGIVGQVEKGTKSSEEGGSVSISSAKNALMFSYTPKENFVGTDAFDYSVSLDGQRATGTVNITVNALPSNLYLLNNLGAASSSTARQTLLVTTTLECNTNPCIRLKEGQTLTGQVTTSDGVTLSNPDAQIIADISGTRPAGTASGAGVESKVIDLTDNSSVSHLTISGTGSSYFTAIFASTLSRHGYSRGQYCHRTRHDS
ncbi:MAG: Ig-like domain-containing protein [Trueperaceae bacterium]